MPPKGKAPAAASDLPDEGDPAPRVTSGDLPEEEMLAEEMPENQDASLADRERKQRRIMTNRASASRSREREARRIQELERNVRTETSTVNFKKEQVDHSEINRQRLQMGNALQHTQLIASEQLLNQKQIVEGQLQDELMYRTIEHQLQLSGSSDISQDVVASAEAEYHSILQQGDAQAGVQAAADLALMGSSQVAPPPFALQGQPSFFPPQYPPRPDDPPAPFQVAPPPFALQGQPSFSPPQYPPRPDDPPAPFQVAPAPAPFALQGQSSFFPPQYPPRPDDPPAPFQVPLSAPLPGMLAPSGAVMPHGPGDVLVYAPPFNPQQPMATINQQQITMPQQEEMRGGNAISELEEVNVLTADENNDLDLDIQRAQATLQQQQDTAVRVGGYAAGPQAEPDNIVSGGVGHDLALHIQQLEAVLQPREEAVLQPREDAAAEQEGGAADQEN